MSKELKDWTNKELVDTYMSDLEPYDDEINMEILRRAGVEFDPDHPEKITQDMIIDAANVIHPADEEEVSEWLQL